MERIDDEDTFLYGPARVERDPRKRKRPSSSSKERPSLGDNWKQQSQAFISNVNQDVSSCGSSINTGENVSAIAYSQMHHEVMVPPPRNLSSTDNKGDQSQTSIHDINNIGKDAKLISSSSSSSTDSDEKCINIKGITMEQREKLIYQKQQYEKAEEKLSAQLLKLKEQREALKEGGAKHEDKIMKDNAKLQKEVKSRIEHMNHVSIKISIGLEQPVISSFPKKKSKNMRSTSTSSEERIMDSNSKCKYKSQIKLSSDEEEKRNKKGCEILLKQKVQEQEIEGKKTKVLINVPLVKKELEKGMTKQKKNKKKKAKYKSSSSSSESESDSDEYSKKKKTGIIQMDEVIFRMVADMKGKSSNRKNEEMFMDLLGKMSEAYMKAKQENKELVRHINVLESENIMMKKQITNLKTENKSLTHSSSKGTAAFAGSNKQTSCSQSSFIPEIETKTITIIKDNDVGLDEALSGGKLNKNYDPLKPKFSKKR